MDRSKEFGGTIHNLFSNAYIYKKIDRGNKGLLDGREYLEKIAFEATCDDESEGYDFILDSIIQNYGVEILSDDLVNALVKYYQKTKDHKRIMHFMDLVPYKIIYNNPAALKEGVIIPPNLNKLKKMAYDKELKVLYSKLKLYLPNSNNK